MIIVQILIFILLAFLSLGKIMNFVGKVNKKVKESKDVPQDSQPKVKKPAGELDLEEEIAEYKKIKEEYKDDMLEYLAYDKYDKMAEVIPVLGEIDEEIIRLERLKRQQEKTNNAQKVVDGVIGFFKGFMQSA